ncbi:MAG: hypothetical protein ABI601_10345 [bacterium]
MREGDVSVRRIIVALLFAALGIWLGLTLTKPTDALPLVPVIALVSAGSSVGGGARQGKSWRAWAESPR